MKGDVKDGRAGEGMFGKRLWHVGRTAVVLVVVGGSDDGGCDEGSA